MISSECRSSEGAQEPGGWSPGQREVLAANLLLYLPNFFCLAWRIAAVEESVMIKKKKKKKKGSLWSVEFEEMRGCFTHMPWVRSLRDYPSLKWCG